MRERPLHHLGVALDRDQLHYALDRADVGSFEHALAESKTTQPAVRSPGGASRSSCLRRIRLVSGENSAIRSLATTAPSTEIVPSALTATAPLGSVMGPCSPITASPPAVTSLPLRSEHENCHCACSNLPCADCTTKNPVPATATSSGLPVAVRLPDAQIDPAAAQHAKVIDRRIQRVRAHRRSPGQQRAKRRSLLRDNPSFPDWQDYWRLIRVLASAPPAPRSLRSIRCPWSVPGRGEAGR